MAEVNYKQMGIWSHKKKGKNEMSEQTESYIILKPIAERFNRIANELTDEDIRNIIKSELRNQIQKLDFTSKIETIVEDYIEDNPEEILSMYKTGLKERLTK